MIKFITGNTLANTVRMGARSRRPKAVFLANEEADVILARSLITEGAYRIIPAHSRENAMLAFNLLIKAGYKGVFTAVNTQFALASENDVLGATADDSESIVGIEGAWEDVKSQGSIPPEQHVRVTFVSNPARSVNGHREPNVAALKVLEEIEEIRKGITPKVDAKDYLSEARAGAMYGFGDDD